MKAKCAAFLIVMLSLGATRAGAAPITYAVSEFDRFGNISITAIGGSITTDGTLGAIGPANIIDWNLIGTVIDNTPSVLAFAFDLVPSNSSVSNAVNLTATANALTLGMGSGIIIPNGDLYFVSDASPIPTQTLEFTVSTDFVDTTEFLLCSGVDCDHGFGDGLTIADGKVIAAAPVVTPLPAALPLFATGLGVLGLLGWRRKRKAQAV